MLRTLGYSRWLSPGPANRPETGKAWSVSGSGFQLFQSGAKRCDIGFERSHAAVQLSEREPNHRLYLAELFRDPRLKSVKPLVKAIQPVSVRSNPFGDGANFRSQPFGDDVEVALDLVGGLSIHR